MMQRLFFGRCLAVCFCWVGLVGSPVFAQTEKSPEIKPYVNFVERVEALGTFDFTAADAAGRWGGFNQIDGFHADNDKTLWVRSNGADPYFSTTAVPRGVQGEILLHITMKSNMGPSGEFFWGTKSNPGFRAEDSVRFDVENDDHFHTYTVKILLPDELTHLRLDPGVQEGEAEIESIVIQKNIYYPLSVKSTGIHAQDQKYQMDLTLENHSDTSRIKLNLADPWNPNDVVQQSWEGTGIFAQQVQWSCDAPFTAKILQLQYDEPEVPTSIHRLVMGINPDMKADGETIENGPLSLHFDKQGRGAFVVHRGKIIGSIFPLAYYDDSLIVSDDAPKNAKNAEETSGESCGIPVFQVTNSSKNAVQLKSNNGTKLSFVLEKGEEIRFEFSSNRPMHGPVFRPVGSLEQGLLSGVEYLGKGEASSSTADIETEERVRYSPPVLHLTMPLAGFVTDSCSMAMLWNQPEVNVIYATPDFLTRASEHRMNLFGTKFSGAVRVAGTFDEPGGRLEDAILWGVLKRGLPPLPKAPRTSKKQHELNLLGLTKSKAYEPGVGWRHAYIPGMPNMFAPHNSADMISTIWQISGSIPEHGNLVPGGAHLPNPAVFFLEGKAAQWLDQINRSAANTRARQQPDGSFRYSGVYLRGHFEDTASGFCGHFAHQLLQHHDLTGNKDSLEAGLKALKFIKQFRTPRGAQTWELSLHTPDIMASGWCCWANVLAFEATGEQEYLKDAKRWALTGLPFVYQWSKYPTMVYATTPVLGATNWVAPNWIGLPVQWCGLDFGEALFELAKHDKTLDWKKIAEGILLSAEHQQYTEGDSVGLLPDSFNLKRQGRNPADIVPVVMEQQRRRLDGKIPTIAVVRSGGHIILSPFPVTVRQNQMTIEAKKGTTYDIIIDGKVKSIQSQGKDQIPLPPR